MGKGDYQERGGVMGRIPFFGTVAGVILLVAGLLITGGARSAAEQQERALDRGAQQVAASFTAHFERAASLDLLLAQHPALQGRFGRPADRVAAERALGYLQVLYRGAIAEACLINESGRELARVSNRRPAPAAELSTDERANQFFAAASAVPVGQVQQSAPYVSPDTKQWVIANSTWVRATDGRRRLVHFEVALASFAALLSKSAADQYVTVISGRDGKILLDSRGPLPATEPPGRFRVTPWSAAYTTTTAATGRTRVGAKPAAYARVDRSAGNANHWFVVEWSTSLASPVPASAGLGTTALALVLLAVALGLLRRQQATLRAAAQLDHLTGLVNRAGLDEALAGAVQEAALAPEDYRLAVLVLDLDGFKQVNDTLGHDQGDLVLQEVARRLFANVFEYDTAARLGGDEFAVVLRRLRAADDVGSIARRLRDALSRPIVAGGAPRFIGASLGAAVFPEHGRTPAELLRAADAAMYRAKRGREGVRLYDPGTAAGANALGLAADLQAALDEASLELVFQPQFEMASGRVLAVEALSRWPRRGRRQVPPAEFVPLAEQTGLIGELTRWTVGQALDAVLAWQAAGVAVPVAVNLSGAVAADHRLADDVVALLSERGLDGAALILEVTETAFIADRQAAVEVLQRLRRSGVRIELDDFGAGYASFGALQDLPLDGVKIDRELVADQAEGEPRLLAATIELAHRRHLTVTAEGIEDADTLRLVDRLGCDAVQGFHLARPMTADAIAEFLADRQPATLA